MAANVDRDVRKLKSSVKSLQGALAAVADDLAQIGASGKTQGLDAAKAQIDEIRDQIGSLMQEPLERVEEMGQAVSQTVRENPMTAVATAFAAGLAAALLLSHRR
ncbi:MAG: hypothetical protein AB7O45_00600 [Alphaproteobacteria bacterium]